MTTAPLELLEILSTVPARPAHQAVREEAFAFPAGPLVLVRCACGGLYARTAIARHIADPAPTSERRLHLVAGGAS